MTVEVTLLKQYPLFSDLNETQLREVAQLCEAKCFYPDHTLFKEGQPGTKIFILVKGEVELLFTIGEEGPTRVGLAIAGEIIGCPGLVPPYTNTATARSLTEIEVLAIDIPGLRELYEQDCPLVVSIQQHIIQSLLDCIVGLRLEVGG
jgi:CRP-like cAMP-binding protein